MFKCKNLFILKFWYFKVDLLASLVICRTTIIVFILWNSRVMSHWCERTHWQLNTVHEKCNNMASAMSVIGPDCTRCCTAMTALPANFRRKGGVPRSTQYNIRYSGLTQYWKSIKRTKACTVYSIESFIRYTAKRWWVWKPPDLNLLCYSTIQRYTV